MYLIGRVMMLFSWIQPQVNINFKRSHSFVEIYRLLPQISSVAKSLLWRLSKLSNNIKNYNIITFLDFIVWKCIDFVNIFLYLCKCAHVYRVVCQWVWVSMELNLHTTMSPPPQPGSENCIWILCKSSNYS